MSTSLLEWKKQQWAKERAEMETMNGLWGLPPPAYKLKHEASSSRYSSTLEIRETCPVTAQQNLLPRRQRSPSLPPILRYDDDNRNRPEIQIRKETNRPEDGGETSGYASDTVPHPSPKCNVWQNGYHKNGSGSVKELHNNSSERFSRISSKLGSSLESEGRPRWGDKGVAVGRLWEPQDPDCRLPQMQTKNTPRWVERGLNMIDNGESQILVINHNNNDGSQSPVNLDDQRNMSEQNTERGTFLLGQSAPLEPSIKAEREIKRIKARELQAAIMQQLEDRQKQKKEEKERRVREDIEEEERFRRQKELERQRLEEERRLAEEKRQREQRRSEALRLALEKAEQDAKQEKESRKVKKLRQNFDSMSIRSEEEASPKKDYSNMQSNMNKNESKLIQNIFIEQAFSPRCDKNAKSAGFSRSNSVQRESAVILPNQFAQSMDRVPGEVHYGEERKHMGPIDRNQPMYIAPSSMISEGPGPMSLVQMPISTEMFAPMHVTHSSGMQMAFLMPQQIYPCVHQPISMQAYYSETSVQHQRMPVHKPEENYNSNRTLTPTKYRNGYCRDVYTQTDISNETILKIIHGDARAAEMLSIEANGNDTEDKDEVNEQKKDKKYLEDKSIYVEKRPKWGVNKPPTQYKKQSEKDLFYPQKRKLKQRKRIQDKTYTSHSSDENKSPSPVRGEWGKRNHKYTHPGINNNYIAIQSPQSSAHVVHNHQEPKRPFPEKPKLTLPKRGMTLSQKFINDKYGNPQICSPETESQHNSLNKIDYHVKIDDRQRSSGKEKNDQRKFSRVKSEQNPHFKEDTEPLLDQLRSLKDNLKRQQKIWGNYEVKHTKKSPSPNNELDLEYE